MALTLWGLACSPQPPTTARSEAQQQGNDCLVDRLGHGGQFLRQPDGVDLWFKVSGPPDAAPLVYLHGGPGYDAYAFERSAGKRLEASFRMIYVDQRGCGRSGFEGPDATYGMQKTLEDIERLRSAVGVDHWGVVGHSFGAIVAAEYIRRHREHVDGVVLVDMSPEVGRVLSHQLDVIDGIAASDFPDQAMEVRDIINAPRTTPFERLQRLYALLGRLPIQLHLHYPSQAAQVAMDELDAASGLSNCTSSRVPAAFAREGYLDDRDDGGALGVPALLISGSASEVIGAANLARAASIWGASLTMLEGAGHFVYFDQPAAFAELVTGFFRHAADPATAQAPCCRK